MIGRRTRRWIITGLALLLAGVGSYQGCQSWQAHARMGQVHELREQLSGEAARSLAPEQRIELRRQLGEAMRRLAPDQRRQLDAQRRRQMMSRIDHYFELSPRERIDYLDAQVRRMETLRRERDGQRNSQGGPSPGDNGFGLGRPGRGNGGALSAEDRERRRKQRLDNSTPEDRAKMSVYSKDLANRRRQLAFP